MKRIFDSFGFASLLAILVPGLGHIYRRHYLFGIFVFLVMILAATIFYLSFLIPFPGLVLAVLLALPAAFYLLSFIDLWKTVKTENIKKRHRTNPLSVIMLILAVCLQVFVPVTPTNFLWHNHPSLYKANNNDLAPLIHRGDTLLLNSLAYRARLFFIDRPIIYSVPEIGELVSFKADDGTHQTGLVAGIQGDEIEIVDGRLYLNGYEETDLWPSDLGVPGSLPLTLVEPTSILIVTLKLGVVEDAHQVRLDDINGEIHRLF